MLNRPSPMCRAGGDEKLIDDFRDWKGVIQHADVDVPAFDGGHFWRCHAVMRDRVSRWLVNRSNDIDGHLVRG